MSLFTPFYQGAPGGEAGGAPEAPRSTAMEVAQTVLEEELASLRAEVDSLRGQLAEARQPKPRPLTAVKSGPKSAPEEKA